MMHQTKEWSFDGVPWAVSNAVVQMVMENRWLEARIQASTTAGPGEELADGLPMEVAMLVLELTRTNRRLRRELAELEAEAPASTAAGSHGPREAAPGEGVASKRDQGGPDTAQPTTLELDDAEVDAVLESLFKQPDLSVSVSVSIAGRSLAEWTTAEDGDHVEGGPCSGE